MHEPMTAGTDFILATVCWVLGAKLINRGRGNPSMQLWGTSFHALAFAAFNGGIMHGFVSPLQPELKHLLWRSVMTLIGLSLNLMASALLCVVATKWGKWVMLNCVTGAIYGIWTIFFYNFQIVLLYVILSLVVICFLCTRLIPNEGDSDPVPNIAAGLGLSFAGLVIQVVGWAPAPWFNYNDLCHVIQIGAMYFLYSGGLLLKDAK